MEKKVARMLTAFAIVATGVGAKYSFDDYESGAEKERKGDLIEKITDLSACACEDVWKDERTYKADLTDILKKTKSKALDEFAQRQIPICLSQEFDKVDAGLFERKAYAIYKPGAYMALRYDPTPPFYKSKTLGSWTDHALQYVANAMRDGKDREKDVWVGGYFRQRSGDNARRVFEWHGKTVFADDTQRLIDNPPLNPECPDGPINKPQW